MSLNQQIDAHKLCSGWLYKKGYYNTSWKKRYFVLYDDRTLHYFSKESHAHHRRKAKGTIHLTQISRIELVHYIDVEEGAKSKSKSRPLSPVASPHLRKSSSPLFLLSPPSSHHRSQRNVRSMSTSHLHKSPSKRMQSPLQLTSPSSSASSSPSASPSPSSFALQTLVGSKSFDERRSVSRASLRSIDEQTSVVPSRQSGSPGASLSAFILNDNRCVSDIDSSTPPLWNGVNGWSFQEHAPHVIHEQSYCSTAGVISSYAPPPEYDPTQRTDDPADGDTLFPSSVKHGGPDNIDDDEYTTPEPVNAERIPSTDVSFNSIIDVDSDDFSPVLELSDFEECKRDEFSMFQTVLDDTSLNLQCDRKYGFSLIGSVTVNREYIFAADNLQQCQQWLRALTRLTQGKPVYSGHLAVKHVQSDAVWYKKHFVLFENQLLNYYYSGHDHDVCECDLDLRHIIYLRYCAKNEFPRIKLKQFFAEHQLQDEGPDTRGIPAPIYSLEIGTQNRVFVLTAPCQQIRNEWYNAIRSVFPSKLVATRYFDSAVSYISMTHNGQCLRNRYIALYETIGLVVLRDKLQLEHMKRMTFFDAQRFRDYIKKLQCTIVPLQRENVNIYIETTQHAFATRFIIVNAEEERQWVFCVQSTSVAQQWISVLLGKYNARYRPSSNAVDVSNSQHHAPKIKQQVRIQKRRKMKKKAATVVDIQIESSLSHISAASKNDSSSNSILSSHSNQETSSHKSDSPLHGRQHTAFRRYSAVRVMQPVSVYASIKRNRHVKKRRTSADGLVRFGKESTAIINVNLESMLGKHCF